MTQKPLMTKDTLYKIFETAEKEHINLFHSISKKDFYKELNNVAQNIEVLNTNQINYEMCRLFSLFKDAHTSWALGMGIKFMLPISFAKENDKYFITGVQNTLKDLLYKEVTAINGVSMDNIYSTIKEVISSETEQWSAYCALSNLSNTSYLKMASVDTNSDIVLTVENINYSLPRELDNFITYESNPYLKSSNYSLKTKNGVKVIEYVKCREHQGYPFEKFLSDVKNFVSKNENIIVDLRGNTGGDSRYFSKLVNEVLVPKNIKGCVLIDEGVFSSGTIATKELKNLDFKLIGQPTGGVTKCYGQSKWCEVDKLGFTVCEKKFDFTSDKIPDGPIEPDIYVRNSIEDYKSNRDVVMETAIKYLNKTKQADKGMIINYAK